VIDPSVANWLNDFVCAFVKSNTAKVIFKGDCRWPSCFSVWSPIRAFDLCPGVNASPDQRINNVDRA